MSSSIKSQTVEGYVEEIANSRHISVIRAMQLAVVKEFIKMKGEKE